MRRVRPVTDENARCCPECELPCRWDPGSARWVCRRCGQSFAESHTAKAAIGRAKDAISRAQEKAKTTERRPHR